jgi:hypothetical protein
MNQNCCERSEHHWLRVRVLTNKYKMIPGNISEFLHRIFLAFPRLFLQGLEVV